MLTKTTHRHDEGATYMAGIMGGSFANVAADDRAVVNFRGEEADSSRLSLDTSLLLNSCCSGMRYLITLNSV